MALSMDRVKLPENVRAMLLLCPFNVFILSGIRISGSQFAICNRVLMISEWPFALFSKSCSSSSFNYFLIILIPPGNFQLIVFINENIILKASFIHLKNALLITVCTTNLLVVYSRLLCVHLFGKHKKVSPTASFFHCLTRILLANLFFP